jgi:hypothetical protein
MPTTNFGLLGNAFDFFWAKVDGENNSIVDVNNK